MNKTAHEIEALIETYSLSHSLLCLHMSFSRLSRLIPSPETFIDLFLTHGTTLVVPAHCYRNRIPYVPRLRIRQNGDADQQDSIKNSQCYERDMNPEEISPLMGIVAQLLSKRAESHIGFHPENAFAGIGPEAESIIKSQTPWNVYAPYDILMEDTQAKIVLIDVDLSKATPIHYAEMKAGRNPFIRWYKDSNHNVRPMRVGGCSDGFEQCRPYLKDLESVCHIGLSTWRIYPFQAFINRVSDLIRDIPEITRCDKPICLRCKDSIAGGPYFSFPSLSTHLMKISHLFCESGKAMGIKSSK